MNHSMDDHADMNDIECVLGKRARWLATRMAQAAASGRVLVHDRLEYAALQWTVGLARADSGRRDFPLKLMKHAEGAETMDDGIAVNAV